VLGRALPISGGLWKAAARIRLRLVATEKLIKKILVETGCVERLPPSAMG
jgi:hypothetical protein